MKGQEWAAFRSHVSASAGDGEQGGLAMDPSDSPNGRLVAKLLFQVAQTVVADDAAVPAPPLATGGECPACEAGESPNESHDLAACVSHKLPSEQDTLVDERPKRCAIRVVLVCGPPSSGKSTYVVETFDGVVEPVPFEVVTYRNFLSSNAYPRVMPLRRQEVLALAMFQEFTESVICQCQQYAASRAADDASVPVVVMEGPFFCRSLRLVVIAGLRGVLRECDALECRWVGYPRVVGDAMRRAGYDTFKRHVDLLQAPSIEEGFDELRVLSIPQRSICDEVRLRVELLNERDTVTEHNLLCRSDLSPDPRGMADSRWQPAALLADERMIYGATA